MRQYEYIGNKIVVLFYVDVDFTSITPNAIPHTPGHAQRAWQFTKQKFLLSGFQVSTEMRN